MTTHAQTTTSAAPQKTWTDLSDQEVEHLMTRIKEAQAHHLALTPDDTQLLLDALMTLACLQERLNDKDVTLHKLRKLLGIVRASEKLRHLVPESDQDAQSDAANPVKKPASKPRKPTKKKKTSAREVKPRVEHHGFADLKKGDVCGECGRGKLYKYDPASLLRITGNSSYTPVQHINERLRCNACGALFTAPLPETVRHDGHPQQKYGYSARSIMSIHKYFGGLPFERQQTLQSMVGMAISASTIFDQCEHVANAVQPVFNHLLSLAADAVHYHIDDTSHRILEAQPVERKRPCEWPGSTLTVSPHGRSMAPRSNARRGRSEVCRARATGRPPAHLRSRKSR